MASIVTPQATPSLYWLTEVPDWRDRLRALRAQAAGAYDPATAWREAVALARAPLDFMRTVALDQAVQPHLGGRGGDAVRLAVLSTSTVGRLGAAIRLACLRRGLACALYEPDYGQWLQQLNDPESGLYRFEPTAILFATDARTAAGGLAATAQSHEVGSQAQALVARMARAWRRARDAFGCQVIQQTCLPLFPGLIGENEHLLAGAPTTFIRLLNAELRQAAADAGVDILGVDAHAAQDGTNVWHDPALWFGAKQEISAAAPLYGDLVARVIAARRGLSAKCLVLDLDNTIWGGVVGDDGVAGLVLGQGSAAGEAYLALQAYAKALAARGVILAVCSKNDEAAARAAFAQHPEMALKLDDIACFVANWQDKATNLRAIAQALNLGLDSLVFVDDNPAERDLVRRELPTVSTPELPEDPALVPRCLADAGYFEAVTVTAEDRARNRLYRQNAVRAELEARSTDLEAYLADLDMRLSWAPFDSVNLPRIVQLINKTNQFNLTTHRMSEAEVRGAIEAPDVLALQFRLKDRFGDNGIIAVVIARAIAEGAGRVCYRIETWLMSCRVLGRGVETATLNVVAAQAQALGASALIGVYRPTERNGIVADHYAKLGFRPYEAPERAEAGGFVGRLDLADFAPHPTRIAIDQGVKL
jgi:FkbH-like protein